MIQSNDQVFKEDPNTSNQGKEDRKRFNILIVGSIRFPETFKLVYELSRRAFQFFEQTTLGENYQFWVAGHLPVFLLDSPQKQALLQRLYVIDALITKWEGALKEPGYFAKNAEPFYRNDEINPIFSTIQIPFCDFKISIDKDIRDSSPEKNEIVLFENLPAFNEDLKAILSGPNHRKLLYDCSSIRSEIFEGFFHWFQKKINQTVNTPGLFKDFLQEMDLNLKPDLDVVNTLITTAINELFADKPEDSWHQWLMSCFITGAFSKLPEFAEIWQMKQRMLFEAERENNARSKQKTPLG
jgi:hypothetical protein